MYFDQLFPDARENFEAGMRQCQMVMLRMLKIIDHLCEKHNISYFLNGGTLLGAIRHQGFISFLGSCGDTSISTSKPEI